MKTIAKKCKKAKKTTLLPIEPVPQGPFAPPLGGRFKLPRFRDRQAVLEQRRDSTTGSRYTARG